MCHILGHLKINEEKAMKLRSFLKIEKTVTALF